MNILSKFPLTGHGGYTPIFHLQVSGLAGIIEKAVSGSDGEYILGNVTFGKSPIAELSVRLKTSSEATRGHAIDPKTNKLLKSITGYNPSYTLEAVIQGEGSKHELPVDTSALINAEFKVASGASNNTFLHHIRKKECFLDGIIKYFGRSQTAKLTYSQNAAGLTYKDVGNSISGFAQALECVVNGIYKKAKESSPDKTLRLELGEKVSMIKVKKIPPATTIGDKAERSSFSEKTDEEFVEALQPTKSSVTFNDIGGYQCVKEQLNDFLLAIKNPQEANRHGYTPSKGVLLHGPPGTGKTLFGKALAGEAGAEFIYYNASDMLQKYVGDSPKALTAAFERGQQIAKETTNPVILFIDELDSVFPQRGSAHDVKIELVNLFNQYMDGLKTPEIPNVWVVGTTNRLGEMDESATRAGRFVKIAVPLPDLDARTAIFQVTQELLEKEAGTRLFDAIDYTTLAITSENLSGADIANVIREARRNAFRRAATSGNGGVVRTTTDELKSQIAAYKLQNKSGSKPMGFRQNGG